MYWENTLEITMKDHETALSALAILKDRLISDFDLPIYCVGRNDIMRQALEVEDRDRVVFLAEEGAGYVPTDDLLVIPELMQHLAGRLREESFSFVSCSTSTYDETEILGRYDKGELTYRAIHADNYGFECQNCGEEYAYAVSDHGNGYYLVSSNDELVASTKELQEGKISVCPACGYENELFAWFTIKDKTIPIP